MKRAVLALCFAMPAVAQDNSDLQTGIDQIIIQPLEDAGPEDIGGFLDAPSSLSLDQLEDFPQLGFVDEMADVTTAFQDVVERAPAAQLRALDRLNGQVQDLDLAVGQAATFGKMTVRLGDCRYPVDNPASDAYAFVTIKMDGEETAKFEGWMIASSPALNAMDDPRYDLWPLTCKTS